MYYSSYTIPLKGSASFTQNNLSVLKKDRSSLYCVVGKNTVYLSTFENEKNQSQNQITPKLKDVTSEGQQLINILQAKILNLQDRILIIILTTKGIFFYEEDGSSLIYHHNLDVKPIEPEQTTYARGVTSLSPNMVAVGTSFGIILLFEIPTKGNKINLKNEINDKHFQSAIVDLASDLQGFYLCGADTCGNCVVFNVKTINNIKAIQVFEKNNESVTCLSMWQDYLIAAKENGVITIYDIIEGIRLIDINAHARWISSLDVRNNYLVTGGEDCYIRVWEFNELNKKLKVNHLYSGLVKDTLIASAQFNNSTDEICISSYDNMEIIIYKSK